jgi:hypothetical protein
MSTQHEVSTMSRASNAVYYIIMAIFQGIIAFQWYVKNTITTGNVSTAYMLASYGAIALTVVSVLSIFLENDNIDTTELDMRIPFIGLTFPKWLYYILSFCIILGQLYSAVIENRNTEGFESTYAFIWVGLSLVMVLATYSNCKGYMKKRAIVAANKLKQAAEQQRQASY